MRHRLILAFFILTALLGLVPERSLAQGIPSDGREFWLGYIRGTDRIYWGAYNGIFALVSSYVGSSVKVNYFDEDGNEIEGASQFVGAGQGVKIPLDRGRMRGTLTGEDVAYRAAVIRSDQPVNVQFYSEGSFNGCLYQAYPTPTLGRNYVVASHFDAPAANGSWSGDSASSTFMVIAPFDNTQVTITPQTSTMSGKPGVNAGKGALGIPKPYTITLNRGQTYQVLSPPIDREHDMSGSTITSSKPITVIAGHQRALLGDPGEAAGELDADYRDMAIEQMIPVESWEREGYVSIPYYEVPFTSSMYQGGKGDLYRFYSNESSDQVEMFLGGITSPYTHQVGRYAYTNPERDNIQQAVNIRSQFGRKINVVQHDLYQGELHGGWATGYMSPGMCNVIPERKWRHNYIWFVPADSRLKGGQYLNVIAPATEIDKIEITIDNKNTFPLSALPRLKTFTIPQRPDLRGYQLKAGKGCYIAKSKARFIAYVYGFENGGYKDNYGYVSSVGAAFGSGDESLIPEIEIIPHCSSWDVTIKDERPTDEGIAQIELLNDPNGYIKLPGYVSTNVRMNPNQPVFEPGVKSIAFTLEVLNPFKDAYGAVWVVDRAGNDTVYQFTYRAPSFTATPDSIDLGAVAVGQEKCSTFTFTNTANPGGQPVRVEDVRLLFGNKDITIKSVSRTLPTNLLAGESLTVDVCFVAKDAPFPHVDSLVLKTDCFEAKLEIKGKGLAPLIYAYDVDFGTVSVGGKKCLPVKVENRGTAPFTLTKDWVLHNSTDFEFADFDKLPLILEPGESVELEFCYKPDAISAKDSTHNDWGTDMIDPFKGKEKDWSFLRGNAVAPEAVWTEDIMFVDAECSAQPITRIYLTNILDTKELVTDVIVTGEDANEFSFVANEHNWVVPSSGYQLDPGDTVWFDVKFTPDLSKPFNKTRRATITAITLVGRDDTIQMAGHVFYADLRVSETSLDFGKELGGVKARRTVVYSNEGTTGLKVKSVTITDPAFTLISGIAVGDLIPANSS
ncbi:MAG TPA: choice-of-anchor D domain-containing protein, partial [Candidatus Kapabacteria bacterium]|nr:choice-of-anchor D domain-containing protein [Candidatus Kapabacteria bacterium]